MFLFVFFPPSLLAIFRTKVILASARPSTLLPGNTTISTSKATHPRAYLLSTAIALQVLHIPVAPRHIDLQHPNITVHPSRNEFSWYEIRVGITFRDDG